MSAPRYDDDASLQRWGANLGSLEAAAAEIAADYARAEEKAAQYQAIVAKLAAQYETELPASNRLAAEVDALRGRAGQASSAEAWRSVSKDSATLPATYQREHETDEDRLAGGRGGRHRERRADVSTAEQDN